MNLEAIAIATSATVGLVQVVKTIGLPTRFAPLVSVLIGVGMAALFGGGFHIAIIGMGIMIGLTSCGLYSGIKTTAGK